MTLLTFEQFCNEYYQQGRDKNIRSKDDERDLARQSPIFKETKYQGWTIKPSIHAGAQAYDRRPGFEFSDWKKMHRNVVLGFNSKKDRKSGDYLFYSKSMDQAYVTSVDTRKKEIRIVTVLPKGRSNPKPGTERLVVEDIEIMILETIDIE